MLREQQAWIEMKKVAGETSVDISIDLTAYYKAYRNKLEGNEQARRVFNAMRAEISNQTSPETMRGAMLLSNLIELAIADSDLDQRLIESTPAYHYMADSLCESLKNSMDEILKTALDSTIEFVRVNMRVEIELDKQSNTIAITCTDQGPGFSEDLIGELQTPATRVEYVQRRGSKKYNQADHLFFGGHGRGLKLLIAKVDDGYMERWGGDGSPVYKKPQRSDLYFFNRAKEQGGGAVIKVVTSIEELELARPRGTDLECTLVMPQV